MAPVQGGSSKTRDAALHLVPDFCPVQPYFQLYKTQEEPDWVLSQALSSWRRVWPCKKKGKAPRFKKTPNIRRVKRGC